MTKRPKLPSLRTIYVLQDEHEDDDVYAFERYSDALQMARALRDNGHDFPVIWEAPLFNEREALQPLSMLAVRKAKSASA